MAPKKNITNPSTGKGEFIEYDDKRLRHMSADELRDYYDRVEPLSNDEVDEIYDRIIPKITYEIASSTQQEKPRRLRSSITKIILIAVCLTLMLSVVAQALGVPLWETIVTWTQEQLIYKLVPTSRSSVSIANRHYFSEKEKSIWGDDICNAFVELGFFPPLPYQKPSDLELRDLFYMKDDFGGIFVRSEFTGTDNNTMTFVVEQLPPEQYGATFGLSIERDHEKAHKYIIDGIEYYYVTNNGTHSYVWNYNNIVYTIYTSFDSEIILNMLESIQYNSEEKFS